MLASRQVTPADGPDNPGDSLPDPRPTLLLTRPSAASARFAALFRARFGTDWPTVIAPLMQTRWLTPDNAGPDMCKPQGSDLVFTSETAVAAWCRLTADRGARAWCVGPRTAEAARQAGFAATEGPGTAQGLARAIAGARPDNGLTWPSGRTVATDMVGVLRDHGLVLRRLVVYDQTALPLGGEAISLLAGRAPVLLPLFSPRSAELAARALEGRTTPIWLAAISPPVAAAAAALGADRQMIAAHPDADGLLGALAALIAPAQG